MSHLLRKAALSAIGGSLLVATLGLAPAGAEKPDTPPGQARQDAAASDHDGDADSSASTSYTEDNDTNDDTANNVVDDGDNRHPSGRDRSVEGGSGIQGRSESDPDDDGRGPDRSNGGPDKPNGTGGEDLADQDGNNGCGNDDDFEDDNEGWCGGKPKPAKPEAATSEAKPGEAHTCADGSMERSCGAKPCPNGSMTRPCGEAAAAAEVEADAPTQSADTVERQVGAAAGVTCPAADAADVDAMPAGCQVLAANDADEDDDDTQVLGMGSTRGGAASAETPDSTVSAQGSGGGVLASLAGVPVVGSLVEGELPMTGISTLTFLIVAMAAMVIGFLLVRASRRTKVGAAS